MPPIKKSDLEKLAWGWTENVAPEEITQSHLEAAYKIGLKNCKNCKRNCMCNPCCWTGLGEDKYLKSQPAEVVSLESSLSELRDPTQYVGLKNLGATCYVNSLIQVWFHNQDMRRIIYKWDLKADPREFSALQQCQVHAESYQPCTILGQLQYTFAMLQFGNKRLLDPSSLVNVLELDRDTQQDAQEFSKLLLPLIEDNLTNLALKSQLQQLTQGRYTYINRCSKCTTEYETQTPFYELDLQLLPTLREALEKYLSVEELSGTNKYHCQKCNEDQDAQRFTVLQSLPSTLNFQILRFVFDRETGQKKKLSSSIQFPKELDMSGYLKCPPATHLYSLSAFLSHKGPSTHSGHYTVNIANDLGEWYQFSDDRIERTLEKRAEDGGDNGKVFKRSKVPKGFIASNEAYMLVYKKTVKSEGKVKTLENGKRKETSDSDSEGAIISPVKKSKLRKKIKKKEDHFEDNDAEERKINANDEMKNEIETNHSFSIANDVKTEASEPEPVLSMQENYDKNYQKLNGAAHRAMACKERDFYEALEFRRWELSETLRELVKQENVAHELSLLAVQEEKQKMIEVQNVKRQDVIDFYSVLNKCEGVDDGFFWIPTSFISKWLHDHSGGNEGVGEILLGGLKCPHGMMDPEKVQKAKCVPIQAAKILFNKFGAQERLGETSLCDRCVRRKCKEMRFKSELERDHKEVLKIIKEAKDETDDSYIVGAESLKHWRKLAMERLEGESTNDAYPEVSSDEKNVDENPDESIEEDSEPLMNFNEDLLCEHEKLRTLDANIKRIPGAAWRILKKYFPKASEYSFFSEPCTVCEEINESAKKAKADYKIMAQLQKDELCSLYHARNRGDVLREKNCHKSYFIAEKGFVGAWRAFIRSGKNAPKAINNGQLLCELHKGFLYPPTTYSDLYTIVTEEEWRKLNQFYESDYEIKVANLGSEESNLRTTPDQCCECMDARVEQERLDSLNYDNESIYIKRIDEGEDNENTGLTIRSCRMRRKIKGSHELKVSSQITLQALKIKAMEFFHAAPFDQHLTLDDRELTESDQTLASLGVYPGAILKLKVDTPPDTEVDLEPDSTNRSVASPEKGFKGTGLVPSRFPPDDSS